MTLAKDIVLGILFTWITIILSVLIIKAVRIMVSIIFDWVSNMPQHPELNVALGITILGAMVGYSKYKQENR